MPRLSLACVFLSLTVLLGRCASAPPNTTSPAQLDLLRPLAQPIVGAADDYDGLLQLIGDHDFVLLGEATHGTREFYRERARLTQRLIEEKGFTVLVLEADWPDAYDLNEFVHGQGAQSAEAALATFTRFPVWMWRNEEVRDLLSWLRRYNASAAGAAAPVGIYGMDLYSVIDSMEAVVRFLRTTDPAAADRAARHYRCLAPYRTEGMEQYAADMATRARRSCQADAVAPFDELSARVGQAPGGHRPGDDALISAWQNARVVANGEAYYRTDAGAVSSWNLRDRHMADTIDALSGHLNEGAPRPAKLIVWAHNSHLGDARMTGRAEHGELNVGQLLRQRHDGRAVLVGFTTYEGTVRAASRWGGPDRAHPLRPARRDSYAALLHDLGIPAFALTLRGNAAAAAALGGPRLQRFVGVVYLPATERASHYLRTDLARQYDAVIHIDRTTAVPPIAAGK